MPFKMCEHNLYVLITAAIISDTCAMTINQNDPFKSTSGQCLIINVLLHVLTDGKCVVLAAFGSDLGWIIPQTDHTGVCL